MTEASARFALPLIQSGQAQKELYHNEALTLLDVALHPTVQAVAVNTPPTAPAPGQCWIVGASPSGAWAGQAQAIAGWTAGGWRFVAPVEGMLAWVVADGLWARRATSGWVLGELAASSVKIGGVQVVGARQAAVAAPSGGSTVDAEARTALAAVIAALSSHGLIAS